MTVDDSRKRSTPSLLSRSLFCWMLSIFCWRDFEENDLTPARKIYDSDRVGNRLENVWLEQEIKLSAVGKKPSLIRVLVKAFFVSFLWGGFLQFFSIAFRTLSPLLFAQLLSFWKVNSEINRTTATYYGMGMILANWMSAYLNHHGNLFCNQFGMKLRVAISSLMYRKIMRMSNGSLGQTTAGKVVNLLANDLQRFDMAFLFLNYVWIIPLQVAAVCYLGYVQAGYAALIGLASLVIIALPLQGYIGQLTGKVRYRTAEKTDSRVKVMSEVINGIQVIKMYAWEIPFQKVVTQKRKEEMKEIKFANILRTLFMGFMVFTERAALFITVLTYILFGNRLSADVIYPVQQFMNAAQINITLILPLVLSFTAELLVAISRVQEFLHLEERPDLRAYIDGFPGHIPFKRSPSESSSIKSNNDVKGLSYIKKAELFQDLNLKLSFDNDNGFTRSKLRRSMSYPGDVAIEVRGVSASWTADPNMLALKNVSLRIRQGKLCAVIGAVGSGKSSFLQLLLKELPTSTGSVSINGSISYACQEAWLFPSAVRENILFGLPYNAEKYKKVCKVCALEKDFKQFPYGDQTLVGERGVSLSGGQRARINLARAVYRETDIYLLDDPLSAVDAEVGRKLFEGCINGYLRGKTRILVTHQIHFLKAADYIVILNEGAVQDMGTFDELVASGKDFTKMLASVQEDKQKENEVPQSPASDKRPSLGRINSHRKSTSSENPEFQEQKQVEEERQTGNLKFEVIKAFFTAGNSFCFIIFSIGMIILSSFSAAACDYWISFWSNQIAAVDSQTNGTSTGSNMNEVIGQFTTSQYLIIHGVLVLLCILIANFRVIPFAHLVTQASKTLHNMMFNTISRGIMRFFDTSSSGRILNRFTKDMGALDEILPRTLLDVLQIYATLLCILILNAIALYWTLLLSLVLIVLFVILVIIYMKAAQSIKRLEGTSKSPVFSMVSSTLNGIATIRSTGAQTRLIENFDDAQDLHTTAWNSYLVGGSTFGFYLDTLCLIYMTAVILVFLYLDFGDLIAVGSVGLAVTQSNTLTAMLQHGARMLVEFIAQLTSVERVLDYTKIDTEENLFEGQIATPKNWPSEGKIVFKDVNLRYAPEEAPVLKELNITFESGWKIGIVGRTGAGKSSLISAMFRFAFIDGQITIDDINTALLGRQELRSKISIIPQEPVLFSGTIRYNLDPFNIYPDDDLWRALERVELKSAVPSLDFKVTEGGSNFSVGQRQLMCLARAALRSNKILIMDEATANVDPQTDGLIQQTVRQHFADCTVLTIAHRLNTIMDSDRVLVMNSGRIAEYDHPYLLLSNPNSQFLSMVKETGEKSTQKLFDVAKEAYLSNNKILNVAK